MAFTDAPGFRMYYEEHGAGFPLLFINGLGGDHVEWLHQVPVFSQRFRTIAFDNRGAGDSETPKGPYSTGQMADDAAALLSAMGIGRAHVIGASLGGMIAQELALRHSEMVSRLVLACTSPGGEGSVRPSSVALAAFVRTHDGDRESELRRMIPYLYSELCRRKRPGEIEEFIARRLSRPGSPEGYAAQLAAAVDHSAWERLGGIGVPTLVITGGDDRLVPPVNSERISERIPGAKLVVLPGRPHRLFAEDPDAFNREVLVFLPQ